MGQWREDAERWLESEERNEECAEAELAQLFTAMPVVEPSPAFVQVIVDTALREQARRRRVMWWAGIAATVVLVLGSMAFTIIGVPGLVLRVTAQVTAASVISLMWIATTLIETWIVMARAGAAVLRVAVMPQSLVVLIAVELLGGAALYSLHRLLRANVRFRNPGPLCI